MTDKPVVSRWHLGMREKDMIYGYLLLLPGLLGLAIFVVYPMLSGISLAFQRQYLLEPENNAWIGLENFRTFLFGNPKLGLYVKNTVFWVIGSVVGRVSVGFILALLLNREMPFRGLYRALALIPWVMPMVVEAIVWQWIFNENWGIDKYLLKSIGLIEKNVVWIEERNWIWTAILIVRIWKGYKFY